MADVGFLIWKMSSMPSNPMELVAVCKQYGIRRLAIKVLNGKYKYNVPLGDKPLMAYMDVLRENGIIVEGWGYHYPDQPGLEGDCIEERRQKLGLPVYHLDAEGEWKKPYGMPRAAKALADKPKANRFDFLLCSYRAPSLHVPFPFDAFMNHEKIDGASPQVYWALSHNPAEQLEACLLEYSVWGKPIYPMGATFGASFKNREGDWIYWEPTVEDLVEFREYCVGVGINRFYYYSLDWALNKKRFDWLEAATGVNNTPDVPDLPGPDPTEEWVVSNCSWLNGRTSPEVQREPDNRVVVVKAGEKVENLKVDSGEWQFVGLGSIQCWMHGDFLEPV